MSKLSFVIPCYNSEKTITGVVEEIIRTIKEEDDYEIILVNDCSNDNVWQVIKDMSKSNSNIIGIDFSKNFGQHSALMAGYKASSGDIVVSLDDDGQTPADEVYSLINELEKGYDVVYASYSNKKHNAFRNIGTVINNKMCEALLGKPKNLSMTSYFVTKKFIIDEIKKYNNAFAYVPGLILRSTSKVSMVPVTHRSRKSGESGYSIKKLLGLWLNGFTAFSVKPLRIATFLGVITAFCGFLFCIFILVNKIINPQVPIGWSSTLGVFLLIGGMILFVLGIIGEYLGRVYISINNAPQYVIKETVGTEK